MQREWILTIFLIGLGLVAAGLWGVVYTHYTHTYLFVSFLNVGQGDAIFIQSPAGRQVLVDGGPDRSVIRELSAVMPWYDRTIDVVIATHPDSDHIAGLIDVFDRYAVSYVVRSDVAHDTPVAGAFEKSVAREVAETVHAQRGQIIDLGKGAYLEVLFPDRTSVGMETNDASIVVRLVYGATSFLLTGDSPQSVETYLVRLDGAQLHSSVVKVGHHGSRTSTNPLFVGYVAPSYAIISRGCDNRYGHPHQDVLDILGQFDIITKDTCHDGRVEFISDGSVVELRSR